MYASTNAFAHTRTSIHSHTFARAAIRVMLCLHCSTMAPDRPAHSDLGSVLKQNVDRASLKTTTKETGMTPRERARTDVSVTLLLFMCWVLRMSH